MIINETLSTTVSARFDVAVCGGGFAGISAALASARLGKKTVLLEKEYILGGLGTAGLVTIYLPLCDGMGNQVSFSIAEELLRLSVKYGSEDKNCDNWLRGEKVLPSQNRYEVRYNPHLFALEVERLLINAGVTILYGTYVVKVGKSDDKITHIICESKQERTAFEIGSVVDCTGDCDVAKFAYAPTDTFKQGNVLAGWYYSLGKNGYDLHMLGYCDVPDEEKTEQNAPALLINRRFSGLGMVELSEQVCASHLSTLNDFKKRRKEDETFVPTSIASIPQVRMTRKIVGEHTIDLKDEHKYFPTSIGMVGNWRKRGPVYEIPFESLYSKSVKNLICAGRCISTTQSAWDILRVIPCCAVTGQAAGTAAALTCDFTTLDVAILQRQLQKDGVVLHESDLK